MSFQQQRPTWPVDSLDSPPTMEYTLMPGEGSTWTYWLHVYTYVCTYIQCSSRVRIIGHVSPTCLLFQKFKYRKITFTDYRESMYCMFSTRLMMMLPKTEATNNFLCIVLYYGVCIRCTCMYMYVRALSIITYLINYF